MLVCNVSMRPSARTIAADLSEVAAALDAATTGTVVFATLVDDPASVLDTVDAYLGEIMLEAASAADTIDVNFEYAADIVEGINATSSENGTIAAGVTYTTWNPGDLVRTSLSGGNLVATGTTTGVEGGVRATTSKTSGKYYWEVTATTTTTNTSGTGVANATCNLGTVGGNWNNSAAVYNNGTIVIGGGTIFSSIPSITGQTVAIAVDIPGRLIWFKVLPSGTWNNSGGNDPATGTGGLDLSSLGAVGTALYPHCSPGTLGDTFTANFGDTAFTGSVPSGFTSGFPV